jgi:hypothetical protein
MLTLIFATTRTYNASVTRFCLCCLLYLGGLTSSYLVEHLGFEPISGTFCHPCGSSLMINLCLASNNFQDRFEPTDTMPHQITTLPHALATSPELPDLRPLARTLKNWWSGRESNPLYSPLHPNNFNEFRDV